MDIAFSALKCRQVISLRLLPQARRVRAAAPPQTPNKVAHPLARHAQRQQQRAQEHAFRHCKLERQSNPTGILDASIKLRIYNYDSALKGDAMKPVMLWYHGGGHVVGSMSQDHVIALQLAKESNFIVVNVDYRLAPEYTFPVGPEDCYAAFSWVYENIAKYGGDSNRIIIGGESAGGNLAAVITSEYLVTHPDTDAKSSPIIGTLLVSAGLAASSDPTDPDISPFADTTGLLPLVTLEHFRDLYTGNVDRSVRQTHLFAPALTPEYALERFPPTVFVVAKYDVLTKDSTDFAHKLQTLGIHTKVMLYESTIHLFFGRSIISPRGRIAVTEACQALKKLLDL